VDASDAGRGKVLPLRADAGAAAERVLWARFREAEGEGFAPAWLALQCQAIAGVRAAVVLEAGASGGAFAPTAAWPEGARPGRHLLRAAEHVLEKRRALALELEAQSGTEAGPARTVIGQPIEAAGELVGAVVLEVEPRPGAELERALRQLAWGAAWLELRAREARGGRGQRLRDLLELAGVAVEHARFRAAATSFATELATRLHCERASLGLVSRARVVLEAVSHTSRFAKRSNLARATEAAMEEALDQETDIVWPEPPGAEPRLTRHHAGLARESGAGAICSVPFAHAEQQGGVLTLERGADRPFAAAEIELVRALAALAGPTLLVKRREDRFLGAKVLDAARESLAALLGPRHAAAKLLATSAASLLLFLALAKGEFRVTADMTLEARELRAAVAPFDGYVAEAPARAGDRVEAGALLARLDDRELALERARWASELEQHSKQMRQALSERNAAEVAVLAARIDQASAQLGLAEDHLSRTRLVAPFDGVVVSGDLSQQLGAPVRRGDVLFEMAPLEAYRVVLDVDERDVEELAPGQRGTVAFAAFPEESHGFEVEKVTPVSAAKEGSNTFRVEGRLDEAPAKLRPGMQGVAKVDAGRRRLLWIWTHDAIDRLRLLVWSWLP
jgi:RND family efflux transporter MFP subunit